MCTRANSNSSDDYSSAEHALQSYVRTKNRILSIAKGRPLKKCEETQRYLWVEKGFLDLFEGDMSCAILLTRIVFWFTPNKDGSHKTAELPDGRRYIAKKQTDWEEEIGLPRKQAIDALKTLIKRGFCIVENRLYKGSSKRMNHIFLNESAVAKELQKLAFEYAGKNAENKPVGRPKKTRILDKKEPKTAKKSSENLEGSQEKNEKTAKITTVDYQGLTANNSNIFENQELTKFCGIEKNNGFSEEIKRYFSYYKTLTYKNPVPFWHFRRLLVLNNLDARNSISNPKKEFLGGLALRINALRKSQFGTSRCPNLVLPIYIRKERRIRNKTTIQDQTFDSDQASENCCCSFSKMTQKLKRYDLTERDISKLANVLKKDTGRTFTEQDIERAMLVADENRENIGNLFGFFKSALAEDWKPKTKSKNDAIDFLESIKNFHGITAHGCRLNIGHDYVELDTPTPAYALYKTEERDFITKSKKLLEKLGLNIPAEK